MTPSHVLTPLVQLHPFWWCALHWFRPHLIPIGAEHGAIALHVALHHGTTLILITLAEDLLEEVLQQHKHKGESPRLYLSKSSGAARAQLIMSPTTQLDQQSLPGKDVAAASGRHICYAASCNAFSFCFSLSVLHFLL
jgi:hypothetical protein